MVDASPLRLFRYFSVTFLFQNPVRGKRTVVITKAPSELAPAAVPASSSRYVTSNLASAVAPAASDTRSV